METPPCGGITAERLAGVGRIGAGPRLHVNNADFKNVAWFGAADVDRAGADVHAEALAGSTSQKLSVHRTGAATVDALLVLGPQEHAFGARIALNHALGIVVRVMGKGLDRDIVAGLYLKLRLEKLAEIAPMHGIGGRREIMIGRLARAERALRLRRRQKRASRPGGGAAARHESALEEAAPLEIEIVQQLPVVQLKLWAIVIIACAHDADSSTELDILRPSQMPARRLALARCSAPLRTPNERSACNPQAIVVGGTLCLEAERWASPSSNSAAKHNLI